MCLDGEKNDRVAFQARADYQNHAIGWLHRGYSSLGGGKVVRFPRIWMVYGECRVKDHDRSSENIDNLARRLGWIGTLSGILSVFVAFAALLLGYDARNESQKLKVNGLLDEAWDALGGSPNTSFISDFSGSDIEKARRAIRDAREIRPNDPRVRLVVAAIYIATNELYKAEIELEGGLTNLPNDYDLRLT